MHILLNGIDTETDCFTVLELKNQDHADCEIMIVNGFCIDDDILLRENDNIVFLKRGEMPGRKALESMMTARNTPEIHEKLKYSSAAIAGLGGLGSHIAVMLARAGVGKLLLIDFDIVEPSNLNRQNYTIAHLGLKKTTAMKQQLEQINPYIQIETKDCKITYQNCAGLFDGYPVICEALDKPEAKAELVNAVLEKMKHVDIVASSGMAGYDSANQIQTVRKMKHLYLCGDLKSEAEAGNGLMAPRVQICAGHQANMVLRLLLGLEQE